MRFDDLSKSDTVRRQYGLDAPRLAIPASTIKRANLAELATYRTDVRPVHLQVVDSERLASAKAAVSAAEAASDSAAAALITQRDAVGYGSRINADNVSETDKDAIRAHLRPFDEACREAGAALDSARREVLIVLFDEGMLDARRDALISGIADADTRARQALADLDAALTAREHAYALLGYPEPRLHWSTDASVPGDGSQHVENTIRTLRRIVTHFPAYLLGKEN